MRSKYSVKLKKIIERHGGITALHLASDYEEALVTTSDVNRPALQLTGFYDYFDPSRIQIIGRVESTYLDCLSPEDRRRTFERFMQHDIAALVKALADAGAVEKDQYTEDSVAALEAAVAGAESALEKAESQEAVDAAAKAVNDAVKALDRKPDIVPDVDKTGLERAIAAAEELKEAANTPETFAAVTEALTAARAVDASADASQEEVDAAADALNAAVSALEPFRFEDVRDGNKFYFDPVYWAYYAEPQITNGMDGTHFGPDSACTRGHVVTFLWRAAGCPEPKSAETPFTDLKDGSFYGKAVAWAVEEGITNGTSGTTFSPDDTCTRGQIVTFLWRFKGEPEPKSTQTPFTDLKEGAFYGKAVAWAVENGITNGMTGTTFEPDGTCTRGQVVTFLYRAAAE